MIYDGRQQTVVTEASHNIKYVSEVYIPGHATDHTKPLENRWSGLKPYIILTPFVDPVGWIRHVLVLSQDPGL